MSTKTRKGKAPCSELQIVNPATGRCVSIDGKIGKQLLAKTRQTVAVRTIQRNVKRTFREYKPIRAPSNKAYDLNWNGNVSFSGNSVTVQRPDLPPYQPVPQVMEYWPQTLLEGDGPIMTGSAILIRASPHNYCVVDATCEEYYHILDDIKFAVCGIASGGDPGGMYAMSENWVYDFEERKRIQRMPQEPRANFQRLMKSYLKYLVGYNNRRFGYEATLTIPGCELARKETLALPRIVERE